MTAWNAYRNRDFASHIREVKASKESGSPQSKNGKRNLARHGSGKICDFLRHILRKNPGPFSSQLNSEHAVINPA